MCSISPLADVSKVNVGCCIVKCFNSCILVVRDLLISVVCIYIYIYIYIYVNGQLGYDIKFQIFQYFQYFKCTKT